MPEMTAKHCLELFDLDHLRVDEHQASILLEYADAQEAPSLARLAVLRFMWRKMGVQPK